MKKFTARGFTLIELLVVIAIIGILSSVVLASLNSARAKGRDARRLSDIKQLQLALELYYDANDQEYPLTTGWDTALTGANFISVVPQDPQGDDVDYNYASADGSTYLLGAALEADTMPDGSATGTFGTGLVCGTDLYCVAP